MFCRVAARRPLGLGAFGARPSFFPFAGSRRMLSGAVGPNLLQDH